MVKVDANPEVWRVFVVVLPVIRQYRPVQRVDFTGKHGRASNKRIRRQLQFRIDVEPVADFALKPAALGQALFMIHSPCPVPPGPE